LEETAYNSADSMAIFQFLKWQPSAVLV